jgi:hypothetical protein
MAHSSGGSYVIATKVGAPDALCLADHPAPRARTALTFEKSFPTAGSLATAYEIVTTP